MPRLSDQSLYSDDGDSENGYRLGGRNTMHDLLWRELLSFYLYLFLLITYFYALLLCFL